VSGRLNETDLQINVVDINYCIKVGHFNPVYITPSSINTAQVSSQCCTAARNKHCCKGDDQSWPRILTPQLPKYSRNRLEIWFDWLRRGVTPHAKIV